MTAGRDAADRPIEHEDTKQATPPLTLQPEGHPMFRTSRTTSSDDTAAPAPRPRRRPSLGTVLGGTALFVALGGTSYAAATLPAKSVGATQLKTSAVTSAKLKAGAVTSAKVKDGSLLLKDFKAGQLPGGGSGAAGATGPKGDTGAKGDKGATGDTGPAGPLLDVLPSGRSLTGYFAVSGHKTGASDFVPESSLSFATPVAAAPTTEVVTTTPTTNCPGTAAAPTAAPGYLCFYTDIKNGGTGLSITPSKQGAYYFVTNVAAAANFEWNGTWAVTAP